MRAIVEMLASAPRLVKRVITYFVDIAIHIFAYSLSLMLTIKSLDNYALGGDYLLHVFITISSSILLLAIFGFYRAVNRFISFKILLTVSSGTFLSSLAYYFLGKGLGVEYVVASSTVLYGTVLCILLGGSRLLVRSYFSMRYNIQKKRVVIYGAGSAGRQLATSLISGNEYYPVAFIDDDKALDGVVIQGIKVYLSSNLQGIVKSHNVEKVLLALPSISRTQRKLIIGGIEKAGVAVQTIPGMADIVSGKMKIDEFQDVDIEDLLGRDPVSPVQVLLEKNVRNKSVMVTGAGGSIGSELCRQIIQLEPTTLVLLELSEYALYQIEKELIESSNKNKFQVDIKPILGSVVDKEKVEQVLRHFKVDTLYHAAAYKHVPMVEHNVVEGVTNNVFGTLNTALAAINSGVESFVLISTDKAVRSTNIMGASKRFAELVLQGLATREPRTCFSMVRFGNVLGSSGSVVPLFKKQIRDGGPITVTHPDITRYFMTIPEAAQLVIQAGGMGKGGDVFVLDMGEPVKIIELAEKLVLLMGLELKSEENPSGDIEIAFSGLRPGEKLYEELLVGSNVEGTKHPRIMTANEKFLVWSEMSEFLEQLMFACNHSDQVRIREILLSAPTDFNPSNDISDLLWEPDMAGLGKVVKIPKK